MKKTLTRGVMLAAASTLALTMTACGSDDSSDTASDGGSASSSSSDSGMESSSPSTGAASAEENFGEGCAAVPTDAADEGSFQGMADDPVATAASNNPVLSTLVQAVTAAELGDTLNSAPDITVLAPANPAFEAIPADALQAVLADKAMLTQILSHHVIDGRLAPDELAGTHTTLAGDQVTIEGSGEDFTIDGTLTEMQATVICGNVQTANATVYIIDHVLAPAAG